MKRAKLAAPDDDQNADPATPPGRRGVRQPLPSGHPETWGAITDGTLLEGIPYTPPTGPLGGVGAARRGEGPR